MPDVQHQYCTMYDVLPGFDQDSLQDSPSYPSIIRQIDRSLVAGDGVYSDIDMDTRDLASRERGGRIIRRCFQNSRNDRVDIDFRGFPKKEQINTEGCRSGVLSLLSN